MNEIIPGVWRNAYYFWVSERGAPIKVKPIRYIGLKGWNNYIYKKEYDGITYCGEEWLCEDIFGYEQNYFFRILYSDEIEESKYKQKFRFTYVQDYVEINAHTDGFDAYINKDAKLRYRDLLHAVNKRHFDKIAFLKKWFKTLNKLENPLLKLGIQLYLRRLETPTMATSREWKQYGLDHPYMNAIIIDQIHERSHNNN